ncbi:flagellar biosynthesis regulator FlaF [Coralliovum pocilloporae]|uniref:flagellar biosynthesis regulator FlaF n=1 Tax=Coralliovum pocilloporae TaxID=3066369 RepID=UPI0033074B86
MHYQSVAAYQTASKAASDPRELESGLLLKAAARLNAIRDKWDEMQGDLDEALVFNRKLWTIFVTSVTQQDNPLPSEIKQNIANLGIFIFNQTIQIQAQPAPEKLDVLVSINKDIAMGLRGQS